MKKIFILLAIFSGASLYAQDIHFTQINNNPLHINPANTGGYEGYERIVLNYRNQWSAVGAKYNTMGFSFDMPMFQGNKGDKTHLGLGLVFFSDKAGDAKFGITQGALSLAGIVPFNKENKVVAGIQIGYGQRSANMSKLQWGNQFNGKEWDENLSSYEANLLASFGYMDMAAGLRYEFRKKSSTFQGFGLSQLTFGAAMYHINSPTLRYHSGGSEKLNQKMVFHASGRFDLPNTWLALMPSVAYFSQGPLHELNAGVMFRIEMSSGTKVTGLLTESALYLGAQYRLNDAIIPYVGYEFSSFGVGVSYDHNISTLKTVSRGIGGFEISLKYHNVKGALFSRRTGSRIYD